MIHLDVQGIIDLIQAKAMSIFTLLDEECRMPKAGGEIDTKAYRAEPLMWRKRRF